MKSRFLHLLASVLLITTFAGNLFAANPKREMRSTWLTLVSNIDWPSTKGTSASAQAAQKKELIAYLDNLEELNMTSTCLHIRTMGDAFISCCGITLPPLEAEELDNNHQIIIEKVEDEHFITINHDMTKEHYISFVAYLTSDRVQFVKFYPEGNAETRLNFRGKGYIYIYCNKHGLMKMKI